MARLRALHVHRTPRDHRLSDAAFARRRRRAFTALVVGAVALALALNMERGSVWFPVAALGVAAVWLVGAFASGPLHVGRVQVGAATSRPVVTPVLTGALMGLVFIVGGLLTREIPFLAGQVTSVLAFAAVGNVWVLTCTTFVSGVAEELFFRGGLYAAIRDPHQIVWSTVAYTVATVLTGNVMLGFAAAVMGVVTGLQRRATGGVLAPVLTHVTWSMMMLHVLPRVFG